MNLHEKIRKIRDLYGYSQSYMASCLKLSQPAYSKIESGQTKISLNKLEEIAALLAVDVPVLLSIDEKSFLRIPEKDTTSVSEKVTIESVKSIYEKIIEEKNKQIKHLELQIEKLLTGQ